jgi:Domain of unknown function (DUF4249)
LPKQLTAAVTVHMRTFLFSVLSSLAVVLAVVGCVDPYEPDFVSTLDVLTVEGTITDLPEPQFIKLSRSTADKLTGRFGTQFVAGAQVELIVDDTRIVAFRQTAPGMYSAPVGFKGEIGHRYQLRFQHDGKRYESSVEMMPAVVPITKVYQQFNAQSLPVTQIKGFTSANDVYIDFQDPADAANYYRWQWKLWERQEYCLVGTFQDLYCDRMCWEIIQNYEVDAASDIYSNGRTVVGKRVAKVPYFQDIACLVEIRQFSLTPGAYRHYKLLADQTQSTGTLTDTPPAAPVGNIKNVANDKEIVVGYFSASSTYKMLYWLQRSTNPGAPIGLFRGLYGRTPNPSRNAAPCVSQENRTPIKPEGWQD